MRFGFDIDDTLINLREHAFHLYNKKMNQQIPLTVFHQLERVEIHEPFGLSEAQGRDMWNSSLEEIYYTTCPPFPNAVELLQELQRDGHEIYYITARPKEHGERTKVWMQNLGFPVKDEQFFYGMKDEEKITIIKELELDYYFDDKPDVLDTLLKESKTNVFVKNQSYNQHVQLPRISELSEIKEIIRNGKKD
ncbi:5' nucleotidase, NT5C type [Terribacillus halophilus]|uniref:5' nucleotidase, NT5C type n=1 Tax=Terribacillus halophilus TaxID=361279 RepID=UPI0009846030|nr:HAD family acid phosphatase [Terribacillus halophilus]